MLQIIREKAKLLTFLINLVVFQENYLCEIYHH